MVLLGAVVSLAGCAGEGRGAAVPPEVGSSVPSVTAPSAAVVAEPAVRSAPTASEPVERGAVPRVLPDGPPFGVVDYLVPDGFIKDIVQRGRMPLAGRSVWGPFRGPSERRLRLELESPVYDFCDDAQAFEAITGQAYRDGARFPRNTYADLVLDRQQMGCDGESVSDEYRHNRWALRTNDRGGTVRFRERTEALEYQQEQAAAEREKYGNTVDAWPFGISTNGVGSRRVLFSFPDIDSPVDEVRLLDGSVTVVNGALRGMVRNWSRTLWAYSVRVAAHGRTFEWPLSVQPGELAPFQIDDWDGPTDPSGIDVEISAEMLPEADVSRLFVFTQTHGWREYAEDMPWGWFPREFQDALSAESSREIALWRLRIDLEEGATSHPWIDFQGHWRGDTHEKTIAGQLHFDNLRAYRAFFTYSHPTGDVRRLSPSPPVLRDLRRLTLFAASANDGFLEAEKFPVCRNDGEWENGCDTQYGVGFEYPISSEQFTSLGLDPRLYERWHETVPRLGWAVWIGNASAHDN